MPYMMRDCATRETSVVLVTATSAIAENTSSGTGMGPFCTTVSRLPSSPLFAVSWSSGATIDAMNAMTM